MGFVMAYTHNSSCTFLKSCYTRTGMYAMKRKKLANDFSVLARSPVVLYTSSVVYTSHAFKTLVTSVVVGRNDNS